MSALQPVTLWVHTGGPNPFKVIIALEELEIPYEKIIIANPKEASFLAINPNGRLPAIKDPNNDELILWESGAIVEYLVESYDKNGKLTLTGNADKWHMKQYLHFQMSGQGPYFGQAVWFHKSHHEDLPSAKKRYDEQIIRVFDVLNTILEGKQYLVGEKFTYADLVFIPWDLVAKNFISEVWEQYQVEKNYPNFIAWHNRLVERASVTKAYGTSYKDKPLTASVIAKSD